MFMLAAPEGAYANAALFIALARKLIAKEIISKEEMLGIFDDAATLLSGNAIVMRQALQLLPWLRKELGIAEATKDEDHQEEAREGEASPLTLSGTSAAPMCFPSGALITIIHAALD
jgi:hypothetical protein